MKNIDHRKIAIMICYKDRPTELGLLLQSLRTQTYQNFDVFIRDDVSGTTINNYHFLNCLFTRIRQEGHKVYLTRNDFPHGVSKNRQALVSDVLEKGGYIFGARLDDDVIIEPDFLEKLIKVIDQGYSLASGVTAPMQQPSFIRETKFIGPIINRVILDEKGNYIFNGDDCGMEYTESLILPAHHFRSSALYDLSIHKKVNYLPTKLSKHGFREEQIFSYKLLMNGFKIGVDTQAMAWHQLTPSGGERFPDQAELVKFNESILNEFTKEHKDELNKLFPKEPVLSPQELMKETNLANKII